MTGWAVVLVTVVVLLVREPRRSAPQDPAAILRDRFVRGELTEEEYRHATALLEGDPPAVPGSRPSPHHTHAGQEARHDRP
jgi:hypothetical protein